jgi:tRNA(Ile2)-agmatinylcytidine synthase
VPEDAIASVIEKVIHTVKHNSQLKSPGTDPGIVFVIGKIPPLLSRFARKAIQTIVTLQEAKELIRHFNVKAVCFKNGRGIIGALAAVGEELHHDYTYELIAYRTVHNRGSLRQVDNESVFKMDAKMSTVTYNNVDYPKKRVLITPHGPDPVLLGIRGENPNAVLSAYKMLSINEGVERWVVFRSNQGTDVHLRRVAKIAHIQPHQSVIAIGQVTKEPHVIPGRHVIFTIKDESGRIDCAAYEPTGKFRNIIKKLRCDDQVEVYGGVRPHSENTPITVNLEKIKIMTIAGLTVYRNPVCRLCKKHMKSMGKHKGFRCTKCGLKLRDAQKEPHFLKRKLKEGLYIPPSRANRHLTKPLGRYGIEKRGISSPPQEIWNSSIDQ